MVTGDGDGCRKGLVEYTLESLIILLFLLAGRGLRYSYIFQDGKHAGVCNVCTS